MQNATGGCRSPEDFWTEVDTDTSDPADLEGVVRWQAAVSEEEGIRSEVYRKAHNTFHVDQHR
jgi:hypothetical protein